MVPRPGCLAQKRPVMSFFMTRMGNYCLGVESLAAGGMPVTMREKAPFRRYWTATSQVCNKRQFMDARCWEIVKLH